MSSNRPVSKAILLAAGRGKRLQPHTNHTPKPLLEYDGKPTIDYLMDSLLAAGVNEVVLVTHYLSEQVETYAQSRSAESAQKVVCVQQGHLSGTADALQCVLTAYPEIASQSFILSATDYLVPAQYFPELVTFHQSHNMGISVSMKELAESELQGRSSIRFNKDQSISEIVEKPPAGTAPSSMAANLTFVLPKEIVPYVAEVPVSPRGEKEVQHAINSWLSAGGNAAGLLQDTPREWAPE